jgi:hypothetical protein
VASWWGGKVRQFRRHIAGRIQPDERAALTSWLTPAQLELFDAMHRADRRHGLDVVATLRSAGHADRDVLLAGLFHDASKGAQVGLWPRVAWSLGERYGEIVLRVTRRLPGFGNAFERLRDHPERSAQLALGAGCSTVTADLIRHQAAPLDTDAGVALRLADEAN